MLQLKAIIEAITGIASIFKIIKDLYEAHMEKKIEKHYERKNSVITKVSTEIEVETTKPKEEQSDEKLKDLHRRLTNLNSRVQ